MRIIAPRRWIEGLGGTALNLRSKAFQILLVGYGYELCQLDEVLGSVEGLTPSYFRSAPLGVSL